MAGGALALDNSATGIKEAFSSLNKAIQGDASDEARAAYYGSEVALNRQRAEDLRNAALGRQTLADMMSRGEVGPKLYGAGAYISPEYLNAIPGANLGLTTLQPGATPQTPAVQMAQIGARMPYQNTYSGHQEDLANRIQQANIGAGATLGAARIHEAGADRREGVTLERVQIPDPRPDAPPGAMIEVPVQRSTVRGAPAGTYLAPLSPAQAEVQVATQKPMPVRIPDTRPGAPPGAMIDTFAPTGRVSTSPEGTYTAPLTEPMVSLQRLNQDHQHWMDEKVRVKDLADGIEKEVPRGVWLNNLNRFSAPVTSAQVEGDKARQETTTKAAEPFKVDKGISEAMHQTMLNQLDAVLGLQRDSKGMGGLTLGTDVSKFPGLDLGKIEARASEIYQLTGDINGAVRAAVLENVGDKPTRPGGWFSSDTYKPGGTVPGPVVQRDESGQVVRPPSVTTRTRSETTQPKPYEPPKVVELPPAATAPAPVVSTAPAAVPQIDIQPEQKLQISRGLETSSPQDAKASAKRMIQQKPQLRAAIIALLREHNIDTSGL